MKDSMLSLDIHAWLKENEERLEGAFIKKIYQIGEKEFLFKIYKGATSSLYVNLDGFIFFKDFEAPQTPSMFAMYLRKRFVNKRILSVEQVNFDRIISITTGDYELMIELFGGGNIIVIKDGVVEKAYHEREWRYRSIMHGEVYEPPPFKYNPIVSRDKICKIKEKKSIVRILALDFNLGRYAEEVCFRAGVDKNKKELSEEECERIKEAMEEIFKFNGCYLYKDFFSPVELKHRGEFIEKSENFNDCIARYFSTITKGEKENIKYLRILEEQKRMTEEFQDEEKRLRRIGNIIYAHFQEIENMLNLARQGKIDYDRKRKKIKVRFEDEEFELNVGKSVGENASDFYNRAKKMKEKAMGAKRAIREIEEKMKKEGKKEEKKRKKSRAKFWFEKYRWFISSEDILVIAGRDAKTNEEVVKKHLGDKDLYMHADIHGAPSVVIKSEGKEIGENTLKEAAQFAVSMSKAWNAGLGNLSAYWVYPSQVSKMGESGEYVPRGAWVIHGKRNYIHKIPLRLAVGEIENKKIKLVMCGPVDAVKSKTDRYVIIVPGDKKKELFAKKIAAIFGEDVDALLKILPPGKIEVEEVKGFQLSL